ncbi:PREDICTED: histone-lysine N-methyltransferase pr-set7 [Drosophila arizonae]|uniref:[histone H4]-lysine(20) N-methyltransferase n=1 Tax=Drosophila arizonae TaxID=7263 RepID=A0ABM1Q2N1_DROAR|nr:PREDICTED: histone-lysine N-methyltransferase pr-set7 [Drosophila arizonae]XP_017873717.1 PREDICTED: histone-lysine N-methyltransferase pr-set7 [Drosophila arizonae]
MIMVRRRARPVKEAALVVVTSDRVASNSDSALALPFNGEPISAVAAAATNNLLDDQYFASPKRKDCRLMKAHENLSKDKNGKANGGNSTKSETDRIIGVQLATRSQTRTIENFFKASAAAKNKKKNGALSETSVGKETIAEKKTITLIDELEVDEEEELLLYDQHSIASPSTSTSSPAYQNDDLEVENSYDPGCNYTPTDIDTHIQIDAHTQTETGIPTDTHTQTEQRAESPTNTTAFQTHRSALRDSHSSSHSSSSAATSDNIFLQEPVLTLDIDRTPTKASSIRINKSFELANAVFSSPPSVLSACVLNGRFNQIVTLNGHGHGHGEEVEHEQKQHQMQQPLGGYELDQHDSSSCDSGVACSLTTGTSPAVAANRRRKPATPHRILCPSPIKTMPRDTALVKGETLSPRKSPRKLQMQLAASGASKSRRRLNQPKPQAPYQQQQQQQQHNHISNEDVVLVDDEDEEDDVHALLKAAEERENLNKTKAMLKSAAVTATAAAKPKASSTKPAKAKTMAAKSVPLAATNGNREMTEFFPVRRSVRKTKTAVKEEMMRNLEQAVLEERCDGLQVRHFMGKGRGVVAIRRFKRNEFVVEYVGDLISISEATERERRYALDENAGCYMYYFKHKNQQYCIDATIDTGKLGRLINHSRNGNLVTKVVVIKQRPHLVLLAKDDIEIGEELTYDYGDRSKESLLHHPWLAF